MLIISYHESFESEFLIIWGMSFLEKWQLEKFSVNKVDCDGNILLSAKKKLKILLFLKKGKQCTC